MKDHHSRTGLLGRNQSASLFAAWLPAADMPIDANETIEWSATSLILLPTIKNRLNTQLPELFRLLASLQELRAGDHIIAAACSGKSHRPDHRHTETLLASCVITS